jgi:uncharacterized protein YukE
MNYTQRINKIASYTNIYDAAIRKEAIALVDDLLIALTIYGVAAMVSGFANSVSRSSADISDIKAKLTEMIKLIDEQAKDGFGQFASVFTDFRKNATTVISLVDELAKPPANASDTSQIKKAQEFIQAANAVLVGSSAVSGALDQLQGAGAVVGNFIHGIGLNFGFDLTRWHEFNRLVGQISSSLSLLVSKVDGQLKAAAAAGQQTDAQRGTNISAGVPAGAAAPGAESMAQIKL